MILPTFPGDCAWCGEPASERVYVSGRGNGKIYALACADHAHGKKVLEVSHTRAARQREPEVLERREPLCQSCGAEITWIRLVKKVGERFVTGKRMPVDRRPMQGREPKRSLVAVNKQTGQGLVLTDAVVNSGEAQRWLDAGAQLHLSHFMTCSSAARHRRQQPNRTAATAVA